MKLFTFEEVKDIQETWKKSHDRARAICSLADKYLCSEEEIDRVLRGDKNVTSYAQIKAVKVSETKKATIKPEKTSAFKSVIENAVKEFNAENTENIEKPRKKGGWPKGKPRKKVEVKGEVSQETFDALVKHGMCTRTHHPTTESIKKLIDQEPASETKVIEEPVELNVPKVYEHTPVTEHTEESVEPPQEAVDTSKRFDNWTPTVHATTESVKRVVDSLYDTFQKDVTIRITNRDTDVIIDSLKSRKRYLDSQVLELTKELIKLNESITSIDLIIEKLEKAEENTFKQE